MSRSAENILKYDYVTIRESQFDNFKKSSSLGIGQLILTSRRVVFVKFGSAEKLVGIRAGKKYATPEKLNEGLTHKGSFAIPLEEIIDTKAATYMMDPALIIKRQSGAGTQWYRTTILRKTDFYNRSIFEKWVAAINGLKSQISPISSELEKSDTYFIPEEKRKPAIQTALEDAERLEKLAEIKSRMGSMDSKINNLNRQSEILKKELNRKFEVSGELGYSIFCNVQPITQLQDNVDHIKYADREIGQLHQRVSDLKAQVPQGGFVNYHHL